MQRSSVFGAACLFVLVGCGSDDDGGDDGNKDNNTAALCEDPVEPVCGDTMYQDLDFKTSVVTGGIVNTQSGDIWTSLVDARAGAGSGITPTQGYLYARFSADGLEKIALSDADSLMSMDWDIAFRRYAARVNSGAGGPSCVGVYGIPGSVSFESLTSEPSGVTYSEEAFYDGSCQLIEDDSGLPGSPATTLASYWSYDGCVATTGKVFLIQLANGKVVKLIIDAYYSPTVQATCNDTGSTGGGATGAASLTVRWAYLK